MRFGDIDGLGRAAGDLELLGQLADQHRRAVGHVAVALTSGETWGGPAARSFEARSLFIDSHLAGSASAASRTAIILRRLATDLAVAEELAEGASRTLLSLDGTAPVASPVPTRSISAPDPTMARVQATASLDTANEQAEAAWRAAAAGLQQIWARELNEFEAADFLGKAGGFATAPAAAAARREQVADLWNDAEKQARAHAKSGLKGQALSEARNARDVAGARYQANLRRSWGTPSWAKEGAYAKAGGGFGKSVGNLGSEVGVLRGAKGIPVVGAIASGVSTVVDIEQGVEPTRAIAANAASLVVTTALVALATGPAMPFVATALVIGVAGYGVGNLVHGAIAYGDFAHDFKSDWKGVTDGARWAGDKAGGAARAVGRFLKGSPLW